VSHGDRNIYVGQQYGGANFTGDISGDVHVHQGPQPSIRARYLRRTSR
jgi:hypothetical protein